ncbi:MAG: T9SS type A sorting domain-containing protein [Bacteroidota bacterium]
MKTLYLFTLLFLSPFCLVTGQTHNWTGNGGDNDWFNTANWDAGSVPIETSTVSIVGNVTVHITGSDATAYTIDLINGSTLELDGNLNTDSIITVRASATFKFISGVLSGSGILNDGLVLFEGLQMRTLSNTIINNNGHLLVTDTNQTQVLSTTINNNSTGILEIASVGGFLQQSTTATLNNAGTVIKTPDGINPIGNFYLIMTINNDGVFEVMEDQIFLLLAGAATFTNSVTGRLVGNGTYDITSEFVNMGTIAPGNSPDVGSLDITNNFSLTGGKIDLDIEGPANGQYDKISVTGFPAMDGFLNINLKYSAALGDSFTIVTWTPSGNSCLFPDTTTASFDGLEYTFDINCNANDVILLVSDISVLGIDDNATQDVEFFISPNPVTTEASFTFSSDVTRFENVSLAVYNYLGQQIIRRDHFTTENNTFNRGNLPSGLYFAQLETDSKILATARMVLK